MVIVFLGITLCVAYLTLLERKLMGQLQRRLGPSQQGLWGILQPLLDGIKLLLLKQIIFPQGLIFILFIGSSLISLILALSLWLFLPVPFHSDPLYISQIPQVDILIYLTISELGIFALLFAGYSANNIWALIGSLRSTAQLISYSINMSLVIYIILLSIGSNRWSILLDSTANLILHLPILIGFIIIALSETNRPPFDLPEAESELVAGFFTEHSAALFVMFFLAEYISIYSISYVTALLFMGHSSWTIALFGLMLIIFIWVRASLPRLRFDQLLRFSWMQLLVSFIGYVLLFQGYLFILI